MTGNNCLVDTTIVVDIFKKNRTVAQKLQNLDEVFIGSTVIGELYFGAYASARISGKTGEIEDFLKNCTIVLVTPATANLYGRIKANLKAKGKPIPENDTWIAALAIEHNLPLYTTDNHFSDIEGLLLLS